MAYAANKPAEAPAEEKKAAEKKSVKITGNTVNAPLPGRILEIKVKEGDEVAEGQEVAVLEAMKMENTITSNYKGRVKQLFVQPGDTVATDAPLIELE